MDAKDQFAKEDHAKIYSVYRRPTPAFLIEKIISHLKEKYNGPLDLAADVGCGSGQSTVIIAPYFTKVYASDIAEAQIQEAKEKRSLPNVTYEASPSETIPCDDGSVQVVSAASALHWFQLDAFFPECRRVLCNNGILAVYCFYSIRPLLEDPVLEGEVQDLYKEFYALTSKYHAPQAKIAMDRYKDVNFPFEEVVKFDDVRDIFEGRVSDVAGYVSTFSGFQNLKRDDEKKATEFLAYFDRRIREIVTKAKLDVDRPLKLYRDYLLIICRKIV